VKLYVVPHCLASPFTQRMAAGLERYIREFANLEYTESQSHHEWKLYFNVEAAVFLVVAVYAVWRPMAV
jgi:hypothetical protein